VVGQLQHMVGGSTGGASQANFQTDTRAVRTPQRAFKAQPSQTTLKRPTATPAAVAAANEEAFPMDDDTELDSF
jgi:hypothetical protein